MSEHSPFDREGDFELLLSLLIDMVESQAGQPLPEGGAWENDRQWLAKKFVFHMAGIRELFRGTRIEVRGEPHSFVNHASINSLARAAIETFLAFAYIFGPDDSSIRHFRNMAWRYSGLWTRQNRPAVSQHGADVKRDEEPTMRLLLERLRAEPHWESYSKGQQKQLSVRGEWAFGLHKMDIAREAGISESYFKTIYSYLSDYSHASYAAVLQVGQADEEGQRMMSAAILGGMNVFMAFFSAIYAKRSEPAATLLEGHPAKAASERWRLPADRLGQLYERGARGDYIER